MASPSNMNPGIRTRFLIIADTHGMHYLPDTKPLQPIDVVIHCGDLTSDSQLAEYKTAIHLLSRINAPLKLLIPGNHDYTLDTPTYQHLLDHQPSTKPQQQGQPPPTHGRPDAAHHLFTTAQHTHNIHCLSEGTHHFPLANGAHLALYASPYTPAFGGAPGFQFPREEGHDFDIPCGGADGGGGVDVVITHGPPRGVRDRSWASGGRHVGSAELFAAVARARPRLHCFGHIHEGWGAEVVRWARTAGEGGSPGRQHGSVVLADLGSVLPLKGDGAEVVRAKERRLGEYAWGKCVKTSHCAGNSLPVVKGVSTLFVNAAVAGQPVKPPWVVDMELPEEGK
ncbi:metallophosphoesterase domain-containing protein [Chaetomium tenue]|uniref:Metallophosphoesterase domain-containing protein n=1 Tax=Chaetomium tenue TaxID=1854479 RepID=A0ACB7P9N4_9PEZI|nr:metallophosphoesterase domain-containing protein [Chaetomium globosum]